MNAIATEQLFEVPANLFTYADPQFQPKEEEKSASKKKKERKAER
jgi:hypothetical protein